MTASFISLSCFIIAFFISKKALYSTNTILYKNTTFLLLYGFFANFLLFTLSSLSIGAHSSLPDTLFAFPFAILLFFSIFQSFKSTIYLSFYIGESLPDYKAIHHSLLTLKEIVSVKNIYVWPLSSRHLNITCTVTVLSNTNKKFILQTIYATLEEEYNIKYCSIELKFEK